MPPRIKKLMAEFSALIELQDAAITAKDFVAAREIGRTMATFLIVHQSDFQLPVEMFEELFTIEAEAETSCEEYLKAEKALEESARRLRQADDKYYRLLLENPRGDGETGH